MNEKIVKAPITYEDWIDLGRVIIPCDTKQSVVEKWSDPDFKITKDSTLNGKIEAHQQVLLLRYMMQIVIS